MTSTTQSVVDAHPFAELALDAEQPADFRIGRGPHLLDVLLRDAKFLGIQHGEVDPAHDVGPRRIALAHGRAERLLRESSGQDCVGV